MKNRKLMGTAFALTAGILFTISVSGCAPKKDPAPAAAATPAVTGVANAQAPAKVSVVTPK